MRLLLSLLLGLLTTIAIAWSAAYSARPVFNTVLLIHSDIDPKVPMTIATFGPAVEASGAMLHVRPSNAMTPNVTPASLTSLLNNSRVSRVFPPPWAPDPDPVTAPNYTWIHRAHGWPFLALRCEWTGPSAALRGGFPLPTTAYPRALPLIPMWPGLPANTALFALPWFLLLLTAHTLRTRLRLRRGQCPRCAYSLKSLPPNSPCPECGTLSEA